jgi:hypothetical protein
MITNINYLKTALECLEEGQTPMTEVKILKTIQQICEQNIQRIELVSEMDYTFEHPAIKETEIVDISTEV